MSVVSYVVHRNMCFPHNGNIVTIVQLTYYDPKSQTSPQSNISSMADNQIVSSLTNFSPGVYKGSILLFLFTVYHLLLQIRIHKVYSLGHLHYNWAPWGSKWLINLTSLCPIIKFLLYNHHLICNLSYVINDT